MVKILLKIRFLFCFISFFLFFISDFSFAKKNQTLDLMFEFESKFDNNLFYQENNKKEDWVNIFTPKFLYQFTGKDKNLSLYTALPAKTYSKNNDLNNTDLLIFNNIDYRISSKVGFYFKDNYIKGDIIYFSEGLIGVVGNYDYENLSLSPGFIFDITPSFSIDINFLYEKINYLEGDFTGNYTNDINLKINKIIDVRSKILFNIDYKKIKFENEYSNKVLFVLAGLNHKFSRRYEIDLQLGFQDMEAVDFKAIDNFIIKVENFYEISKKTELKGSLKKQQMILDYTSNTADSNSMQVSISHRINKKNFLNGSIIYEMVELESVNEKYDVFLGEISFMHQFNKDLSSTIGIKSEIKDSNGYGEYNKKVFYFKIEKSF